MAVDITVNLTDAQEAELSALQADHTRGFPDDPRTAAQVLQAHVVSWLELSAQQRSDNERRKMRDAYKQATTEEKATIDAILSQYENFG